MKYVANPGLVTATVRLSAIGQSGAWTASLNDSMILLRIIIIIIDQSMNGQI